ncbi:hypothetical protein M405DRAFT_834776, partial [Rhizopogon salebrosus TDB-379]
TAKPEVAFKYDSDQYLEFPESPAPPIDNNKALGHLSRADWPAGKAGNEGCLLDEDDEPQVEELDLEAEEEQGYHTDWSTDLSEKSTVATSISENTLIAIGR